MTDGVIIIGAGGHARVLADALRESGFTLIGFTDAAQSEHGRRIDNVVVIGGDEILGRYSREQTVLVNGVGSVGAPDTRRAVQERLTSAGWRFISVVHPRATVSRAAHIEEGAQIMAGAVIQAGARIGGATIVNTAASVDHDCEIGAYCHIAPGAVLSGGVRLGEGCHIGAGAVIIQGLHIGAASMIGAGAVVVDSHPPGSRLLGVPARPKVGK